MMNLESQDPGKRLEELRRRSRATMDELLADLSGSADRDGPIAFQPDVDLVESAGEFRFYVAIPGMIEDDLLIDIDGTFLTIRGERQPPYDAQNRTAAMQEWRYGFFERHVELPSLVEVTSIRAKYEAGVLMIVAAKLDPDQQPGLESLENDADGAGR